MHEMNNGRALAMYALAAAALYGAQPDSGREKGKAPEQKPPANAGMVVAKDPDGTLRAPTPAEAAALRSASPATAALKSAAPAEVKLADGSVMVVLDPATSMVYSVMTKGPDGKLQLKCVSGEKSVRDAMEHGASNGPASTGEASEK
jgi:hypothetical protein